MTRLASDLAQARRALAETRPLRLVVTDLVIPGSRARSRHRYGGLEVLEAAAREHPDVSRVALASLSHAELAREVQARGAVLFTKPLATDALRALADRAAAYPIRSPAIAAHVRRLSRDRGLTATEAVVLAWLVAGRTREQLCASNGMSPMTFDWHVAKLRQKFVGRPWVHELVRSIVCEVVDDLEANRVHSASKIP